MDITPDKEVTQQRAPSQYLEELNHVVGSAHLHFPKFKHEHPVPVNVNKVYENQLTLGQKVADGVANTMGSWRFIIIQSCILVLWITLNSLGWWLWKWDIYPFIALNLLLSCQAAYAAPIVMMSQNRQAEKDRLTAQNDYQTDCKGEEEVRHIMEHLDHQDALILQIVQHLEAQGGRLGEQEKLTLDIVQRLEAQNESLKEQHQEMLAALNKPVAKTTRRVKGEAEQ
ncbi:MAG TPA: DUF1003 domain-containing protein [Ktedonobacteraceae bacterium]